MAISETDSHRQEKDFFLKVMAWNMTPVSYDQALRIFRTMGTTASRASTLLKELQESKDIFVLANLHYRGDKQCKLPASVHLAQLWELKEKTLWEELKKYESLTSGCLHNFLKDLRNEMLQWAVTGKIENEYVLEYPMHEVSEPLFDSMVYSENWLGFFTNLPDYLLAYFIDKYINDWFSLLLEPNSWILERIYSNNNIPSSTVKEYYQESYSIYEYVLSGRINEIPQRVTSFDANGLCAHAIYEQYRGNYSQAIKLYQLALKSAESDILFADNPFYSMTYVIALMREGSPASKKKLTALLKKKKFRETREWVPAHLMVLIALELDTKEWVLWVERNYIYLVNVQKVLCALILKHYKLDESINLDTSSIEKIIEKDYLKLFQLEYSNDFASFIPKGEALREELGISSLFPPYEKKSEWENALEKLSEWIGVENIESKKKVESTEPQSRIVYHINRYKQVIPRLQKSKDGVTWTKGRNIALATFQQRDVEGMSELDKQISQCVRSYNGGYSIGMIYELVGPKVFALLAGYPLVYQDENPDVPIVITKEEAQLVVTQSEEGYKVHSNIPHLGALDLNLKKENDQLYRVIELNREQRKIIETFNKVSSFPVEAKERLADVLGRIGKSMTVHSDLIHNKEVLKQMKSSSLVTVQLQPVGEGIKVELFVKPFVDYPPYCKAGEGAGSVIGTVKGKRVQAVRNLEKEKENYDTINKILQQISGDGTITDVAYFEDYYQCLDLIEALREQTKVSRTEWPEGAKLTIKALADFPHLNLSLKGVGYWFEIDGELNIDDNIRLSIAELLQRMRQSKGRFVALGDSEFLALSKQLRRRLQELDAMLLGDKNLKISGFNTALLTDMEQMGVQLKKDRKFIELQQRIEQAGTIKVAVPTTLQTELRNYQLEGFQWLSQLAHWGAGACLADDMGLGKTVQAIALMLSRGKQGASLVVVPASVLLNWQNEVTRFAPSLTCHILHDNCGDREKMVKEAAEYDVILTTYGLLHSEVDLLSSRQWNVILLDEAHTIKNKETKMSKAAMKLNGEFRLLLTGTPIQNHLGEIWNLFQFANPGLLGSFPHFNEKFIIPIEKSGNKQQQKQLKKILQPFLLRRTKTEVLDELPQKTEIMQKIELSPEETALYENLRQQAVANLEEGTVTPMQTLAEITRLRQAACHPALIDNKLDLPSSKTQAFMELVDELMGNNHRALVFSQFTSHLALLRKELDDQGISYLYLDGSVTVTEREKLVRKFQQGEDPLFLISLKAGGTGLNLTAADYVIHMDPWWNPAVEDQASDRAHRIGQTRPVTIYRLIASQTIEEKIVELHQSKKSLADSLLDGSNMAHKLTKDEMLELLKGGI